MIDEMKEIMKECFSIPVPERQLDEAAQEIHDLMEARLLPIYLRIVDLGWRLRIAMIEQAKLREEASHEAEQ